MGAAPVGEDDDGNEVGNDGNEGGDAKHVEDEGERHLDTVIGAAGEATENTLSGMGGQ